MTRWLFFDTNEVVVSALNSVGLDAIQKKLAEMIVHRPWRFLVTPGNSFGIMDGGFDLAVVRAFGPGVQDEVQKAIKQWHGGCCPVGSCVVAPLPEGRWLVYAPTMEIPQSIRHTLNAYWAFRSAVVRVNLNWGHAKEGEVAISPAFGSLTGKMSPAAAAMQMHAAVETASAKAATWKKAVAFIENLDRMKGIS